MTSERTAFEKEAYKLLSMCDQLANRRKELCVTCDDIDIYQVLKAQMWMKFQFRAENIDQSSAKIRRRPWRDYLNFALKRLPLPAPKPIELADNVQCLVLAQASTLTSSGINGANPIIDPLAAAFKRHGSATTALYFDASQKQLGRPDTASHSIMHVMNWAYAKARRQARADHNNHQQDLKRWFDTARNIGLDAYLPEFRAFHISILTIKILSEWFEKQLENNPSIKLVAVTNS